MSRASLTADVISPRSSHNHRSENDSNNGSPGVLTFPRRLPRLGHTYQLNGLPDRTDLYVPERPSPLLLSEIAPWRTHEEVQRSKEPPQQQNDDADVPVHDSTELNGSTLGSSPWSFPSTSGSLTVEMGHEQLSTTTGNVSNLGVQQLPIVMQDWLQQIVIWHSTKLSLDESSSSGRQQQRRKAKKRPRSPTDEELPPLPKRAASVAATTTVLQHHWTGGRAHAAKRASSNDRVSDWRNPLPTAILGDFRDSRHSYLTSATEETADGNSVGHEVDPETMWNAVLACSQTLEELLLSCRSEVYVSQLVTVLECARRLPSPEHVFNAMDGGHTAEAINASLNHLDGVVQNARSYQAHLSDKLFSKRKEIINEGVDVVAVRDLIHRASEVLAPVVIDETEEWLKQIDQVLNWQKRVEKTDVRNRNQLAVLQQLAAEAAAQHRFISTFVLQLRAKLEQANELTERVESWRREERTESVKWLTSLVRDVERLEIQLPAAEYLLQVHVDANTWLERADVAIRSRLSLQQVQELLETVVPGIELTDWCEKLKTRVTSAETWLAAVGQFVPDPNPSLAWMNAVRHALEDADIAIDLHDLACEGGRLSVQVPEAQLLQAEVEARSWSSKAEKWIPSTSSSQPKKPKLDELKDHMAKTAGLRDLLVVLPNEEDRREWVLPGEDELKNLVKQAEEWLITFNSVGQEEGKYVSLSDLREIERNGQAICVNLVPSTTKVSKVLTQAEAWYDEYSHLWTRCFSDPADATGFLQVSELQAAVEAAESSLQIDLQEAVDLERVLARIAEWQNSVNFVTGQVSRRHRKLVFTVDDLTRLLKEAPLLPINTNEHVESLLNELETVRSWQAEAATLLREIDAGLQSARQALCEMYGAPSMYARLGQSNENGELAKDVNAAETDAFLLVWNSDPFVQKSIDMYCASTENIHVDTPESEFSAVLSAAAKWCSRSVKYLESQTDIFDTRFFGAFDRFTLEGKKLMMCNDRMEIDRPTRIESAELQQLRSTMESLVGDQMQRLGVILRDRERFKCWCSVAEALVFGGDKKPSLEKLQELSRESQDFPGVDDTVRRIRKLADDATHWALQARDAMATETRLTYAEAKSLCSEGENLGVQCSELAQLRRALKAARSWASRASRSKANQGSIHAKDLQDLIEEHDTLLVSLPEELFKLRQAAKNYCICRRPYDGFMVECDVCGDWFHGPCIGVSEAKANKVDKYTCVRCNLARTYRGSAGVVAGVIRKWTNEKELKKARQVSAQKHQRKVRKETKMIQKLLEEESILLQEKLVLERLCSEEKKNVVCEVPSEDASSSEGPVPSNIAQGEDKKDAVTHLTHKEVDVPGNESDQSPEGASETNPCVRISVIASRLQKIVEEIQLCNDRLVELDKELKEKESAEGVEDMCAAVLKRWCIRVRSLVLVPSTIEQAQNCKPNADGSMSAAMKSVLEEAEQRGLSIFEDVHCISNSFSCMGWALRATAILGRQPHYDEVKGLVQQAALLTLPDEKGLRMLKGMAQRARSWNRKVAKTLTPIPGESSPFDVEYLRDLANAGDDIPLRLPLESRVHAVIEDKGARHCLCGGPSDGRFMLGCDACEKWFHGHCVGIKSNHTPNDLEEWKCPLCTDFVASDLDLHVGKFHDNFDVVSESEDEDISLSSRAPQPGELWPPFGLTVSSDKAVEALGKKCCAIPDCDGDWMPGEHAAFVSIDCQVVTRNHVDALLVNNETQAAETSGDARSEFGDSFSVKVVSEASFSSARSMQCPPGRPKTDSEQALKPSPGTYREPGNASCTAGLSVSVHVPKRTALSDEYVNSSEDNLLHCKVPARVSVHNSIGGTSIVSTTENFQDLEKLHREVLVAPVAESSCE